MRDDWGNGCGEEEIDEFSARLLADIRQDVDLVKEMIAEVSVLSTRVKALAEFLSYEHEVREAAEIERKLEELDEAADRLLVGGGNAGD